MWLITRAPLPLLLAIAVAIFLSPEFFWGHLAGRFMSPLGSNRYIGHKSLRNDRCVKFPVGQSCEDLRIHEPSNTVFLACGHLSTRGTYYPPLGRLDKSGTIPYRDYFLKYDIEANSTTLLQVDGLDSSQDMILHGIDMMIADDDRSKIHIFAVNHARDGEEILLFSHAIGSDILTLKRTFRHPKIRTPNAVSATSLNSFFITNDHHFHGRELGGRLRKFENKYGPWKWASEVVHCFSPGSSGIECQTVSPRNSHPFANGMLFLNDSQLLMVNDVIEASTSIYSVHPTSKALRLLQKVSLGAAPDNVTPIPGSEDVLISVEPDLPKLEPRLHDPLNSSILAPAAILRLRRNQNWKPELLYWDDGSLITLLTTAALDPTGRRLIAGGVIEPYFIVCELGNDSSYSD